MTEAASFFSPMSGFDESQLYFGGLPQMDQYGQVFPHQMQDKKYLQMLRTVFADHAAQLQTATQTTARHNAAPQKEQHGYAASPPLRSAQKPTALTLAEKTQPQQWARHQDAELFQSQFYKTRPCKFWEVGQCARGEGCMFAHGGVEKHHSPDLTKTALCKNWQTGYCTKPANQCTHAHGNSDLRVSPAFAQTRRARRQANSTSTRQAHVHGAQVPDDAQGQGWGNEFDTSASPDTLCATQRAEVGEKAPLASAIPLPASYLAAKAKQNGSSEADTATSPEQDNEQDALNTTSLVDELNRLLQLGKEDELLTAAS